MQARSGAPRGSGSEPENLLSTCTSFLSRRNFTACREFAHRIPRSDSNISLQVDQILAVADVLSAAEPPAGTCHPDWPAILQLHRKDTGNRDLVRRQFKSLVGLLDPNKNKLPFADEALMRVREAWLVLSDSSRTSLNAHGGPSVARGGNAATFWTICPYCLYLHEYEKKYEGCALRCQTCQKTIHGVAVKPPSPDRLVEGKEQYYCYNVSLPLRYPVGGDDEQRRFDDDDEIRNQCEKGIHEENGVKGVQSNNGNRRMKIKTTAKRAKIKAFDPCSDSELESENWDSEFV